MHPQKQSPAPLDWGLLAFLGVIWGGAFLGVELALNSLDCGTCDENCPADLVCLTP